MTEEQAHPSEVEYIKVAVVLAAITAGEVAVYYIAALESLLVYLLLGMATVKFALVVLWFMHLKFDSRLFRRLFVTGLILALVVFAIVVLTLVR